VFIQQNHISDLGGLADTVNAMSGKRNAISKTLKDNEHRTKTLDEHIRHGENFSKYRKYKVHYEKLYSEYKTLRKIKGFFADKKTQKALDDANEYYETHRPDLAQYDSAEDYLKKVMQSHFNGKPTSIPLAKWQSELADKKLETVALYKDYHKLKDETQSAEAIKRFAADLMIPDEPKEPQQKQKSIHREESL
jgi:transcriptional accessory protein Tex/SPT6